ncbi:MAG: glycoside hydrolase family 31 protein [Clostridia bacterium]|nr:glycoside hydrolase family 31 protein [Clostridia bacterium]
MKKNYLKSLLLIPLCCLNILQCACVPPADKAETTKTEPPTGGTPPKEPTVLETGAALTDARYTDTEFYFTTKDGTECRLTLDGEHGWRLQALDPRVAGGGYASFNDLGAAQSLSKYLGEEYNLTHTAFTVSKTDDTVTLRAESIGSYVTLTLGNAFDLSFHHENGEVLMNVSYISAFGKTVTVRGDLTPDEAVVGGGQRFDSINRRGTSMKLYTYDAYDTDGGYGTYVAIPLFATTRGGGMFVNRYETMTASFDHTNPNEWSVNLQNDLMDMYFYADGSVSDVLQSYTDLAGSATLPEEWGQGVLICRRSPDFLKLDGEQKTYNSLEEIPGYESLYVDSKQETPAKDATLENGQYLFNSSGNRQYYYLDGQFILTTKRGNPGGYGVREVVEALIGAGMTPTAIILEGFSWTSVGNSPEKLQDLKDIIAWLDTLNIKTMLYMSPGRYGSGFPGYRRSYRLTATVNGKETDLIPRVQGSGNPDVGSGAQSYIDITNPYAMEWYLESMWKFLIDLGVDGVKIDFCEVMPNEGVYNGTSIQYNFYDRSVFGDDCDTLHHAYSSYFISAFYKSMLEQKAANNIDDGFVLLSRGGGIGSQRNPYMWAGDQTRQEKNLRTQLIAILSSGISGVPFMTYDMAGYAYSKTGDYFKDGMKETESAIFIRSIQYTAFTSVIQTHGDVRHLYELTDEAQTISAAYTALHTELMPYIRKLSQEACDTGMPMMRHLILHAPNDKNVYDVDDEFMLGDALLVAPILDTESTSREVYLPAGTWIDLHSGEKIEVDENGKTLTVNVTVEQISVFLNAESADAASLLPIFNGEVWQSINGGNAIALD